MEPGAQGTVTYAVRARNEQEAKEMKRMGEICKAQYQQRNDGRAAYSATLHAAESTPRSALHPTTPYEPNYTSLEPLQVVG